MPINWGTQASLPSWEISKTHHPDLQPPICAPAMFPLPRQRPLPHGTSLTPPQEHRAGDGEWYAPTKCDVQGAKKAQCLHPGPLVCHMLFFGIHIKMQTHLR